VGKSAASNWFELARHPTSELGRNPHRSNRPIFWQSPNFLSVAAMKEYTFFVLYLLNEKKWN